MDFGEDTPVLLARSRTLLSDLLLARASLESGLRNTLLDPQERRCQQLFLQMVKEDIAIAKIYIGILRRALRLDNALYRSAQVRRTLADFIRDN